MLSASVHHWCARKLSSRANTSVNSFNALKDLKYNEYFDNTKSLYWEMLNTNNFIDIKKIQSRKWT